MDDLKKCKISACCKGNMCGIVGMVLIIIATILTLYTLNGLGILGMFLVGCMLGCHKKLSSSRCCGCKCCEPKDDGVCNIAEHNNI